MIIATTHAPAETQALAAALASLSRPGELLVLAGDLGAGKTAFTQGFCRALGVTDPVTSPTFTLANRYCGEVEINHLDVYRLDQLAETSELGLEELIDGDGITLVEWGDVVLPVLGADYLEVRFTFPGDGTAADDDRTIALVPVGPRWSARQRALAEAAAPWTSEGAPGADGGTEAPC